VLLIVLRGSRSELAETGRPGAGAAVTRPRAARRPATPGAKGAHNRRARRRPRAPHVRSRRAPLLLLALAYVVVAVSGVARSIVAVGDWAGLLTPYGGHHRQGVVLILLGALGAATARRLIPKLETGGSGPFWTLVLLELALMGIASGLAAALSRTLRPPDSRWRPCAPGRDPHRLAAELTRSAGSPRGTSTSSGRSRPRSASCSTSGCCGCAGAATPGRSTARSSGSWDVGACVGHRGAINAYQETCSACTCSGT
jgi:hypothetical protein